jgi:hypothetical protein
MSRTLLSCLGAFTLSVFGCSQGEVAPPAAECVDYTNLPAAPVSFANDIMPIFGLSCIASSCHDQSAHKADLVLGDPSACGPQGTICFDESAKWKYTYKAGVTPDLKQAVLDSLLAPTSKTAPGVRRVAPGQPENSFLLDKVTGQQNSKQYPAPCQNQDPVNSPGACGGDMPYRSPNWCADGEQLSVQKVQAVAQWIEQGAQNN